MTKRVVVHTRDVVASRMAGPGLRAFHLASELSRSFEVHLIAELPDDFARLAGLNAVARGTAEATALLRSCDVVIGQPTPELLRLRTPRARRVFDLFDPVVLELPSVYSGGGLRGRAHQFLEWRRLRAAMSDADLLLCATEAQFSFYAGVHFGANGDEDSWLAKWLVVPFGIEARDPADDGEPVELPGDPVAIWGGGMWPWLDPATAVEAVRRVRHQGGRLRLLFLGGRRPNVEVDQAARSFVPAPDDAVLTNEEWIPYRERARWLRASRVAIMLHKESLEARFAIRTRLFDAIWCGIPVVTSKGGFAAELVEREGLGEVVAIGDVDGVASALERLVGDDEYRARCVENLERVRPRYLWSEIVRPIAERIETLP